MVAPLISAHRGSCGVAGLPAAERYDRAVRLGVDYVELDVRRTTDGVYVNHHDDATPSGRRTAGMAYADLKTELGSELLTLDEVFDVVGGRAGLHVDLKEPGYGLEIVGALLARKPEPRFVVTTGDVESIRTIKERYPTVQAGLTLGTDLRNARGWLTLRERTSELFPGARLKRSQADFVAAHQQLARVRMLGYCAHRQIATWVWTVDDEKEIARFMTDRRVTTLITNRPDVALRFRST
ncbi:MAG TPA: glycerophosphodiester phosphodiesterase [Clostridia bacterium]|nr:glycerophosphodiester phosphodiesterase [Clostridia bacterium]